MVEFAATACMESHPDLGHIPRWQQHIWVNRLLWSMLTRPGICRYRGQTDGQKLPSAMCAPIKLAAR